MTRNVSVPSLELESPSSLSFSSYLSLELLCFVFAAPNNHSRSDSLPPSTVSILHTVTPPSCPCFLSLQAFDTMDPSSKDCQCGNDDFNGCSQARCSNSGASKHNASYATTLTMGSIPDRPTQGTVAHPPPTSSDTALVLVPSGLNQGDAASSWFTAAAGSPLLEGTGAAQLPPEAFIHDHGSPEFFGSPSDAEYYVWYCCYCSHGPHNYTLDSACSACSNWRCSGCTVQAIKN